MPKTVEKLKYLTGLMPDDEGEVTDGMYELELEAISVFACSMLDKDYPCYITDALAHKQLDRIIVEVA